MNPAGAGIPLVSVVVPSFNHVRFVHETIRSIWAQDYPNVELVVVDDGSTDGSVEVIRSLVQESPIPMQVVFKENEGVCRTLNRGLALTSGEFVALCGSDDRYLPTFISTLVAAFDAPYGFVFGDVYHIDEHGERIGSRASDYGTLKGGDIFEDLLLFRAVVPAMSALYPARVLREAGPYDEALRYEDWEMLLRITRRNRVKYVAEAVAEYRTHGSGQATRQVAALVPDMLRIFERYVHAAPHASSAIWVRRARARLYTRIGLSFYVIRDFSAARRWLVNALALWPAQSAAATFLVRSLLGVRAIEWMSRVRQSVREAPPAVTTSTRDRVDPSL